MQVAVSYPFAAETEGELVSRPTFDGWAAAHFLSDASKQWLS
jgi:hypothetical protein